MFDRKKVTGAVLAKIKPVKVEDTEPEAVDELAWIADDIMRAIKDGSAMRLKGALKAFFDCCEDD